MTKHVGIFHAKTHLSALLDEGERGREVTITRHGKPVARLLPTQDEVAPDVIAQRVQAADRIRARAKARGQNFSQKEIKSWIEDGRH